MYFLPRNFGQPGRFCFALLHLGALALASLYPPAKAAEPLAPAPTLVTNDSKLWIPIYGEDIWSQYHPDWQGWFPGGRSNRFHDAYVKNRWNQHPTTVEWSLTNKDFVFDGEWFAVEWFYRAKFVSDGFQQWEGTLGIGHLKDGKLISWTEYYDDNVGNLQHLRLMPPYEITEPVFPWPARAYLHLPYRP